MLIDINGGYLLFYFVLIHTNVDSSFQSLNHIGLRVILDVVYNHVYGSGPTSDDSVLDKVTS